MSAVDLRKRKKSASEDILPKRGLATRHSTGPAPGGRLGRRLLWAIALGSSLFLPELYLQPAKSSSQTLIFFDGVCNLCDGFINFVADRDSGMRLRFGAIQRHTDYMRYLGAGRYAEGGEEALSTLVLVQDGIVYTRSSAALRTVALLDRPWRYIAAFYMLPTPLRDVGYKLVARYRYLIFGRTDSFRPPSTKLQSRFLESEAKEPTPGFVDGGGFPPSP